MTDFAGFQPGHSNLSFQSVGRFFECEVDVISEVRAAARSRSTASSAAEHLPNAEHVEEVFKAGEPLAEACARGSACAHPRVPEPVVARAQLWLGENAIGFVQLLESLFCFVV